MPANDRDDHYWQQRHYGRRKGSTAHRSHTKRRLRAQLPSASRPHSVSVLSSRQLLNQGPLGGGVWRRGRFLTSPSPSLARASKSAFAICTFRDLGPLRPANPADTARARIWALFGRLNAQAAGVGTDVRPFPEHANGAQTMNEMRAAQYDTYGPPEVLRVRTVPVPRLRPGHALVCVAASSVNGADISVRAGKLRLVTGRSFPRGAGFDFAGEVIEAATDVTGLTAGDEVWGFLDGARQGGPSGAAAEYVLAPAKGMSLRPRTISAGRGRVGGWGFGDRGAAGCRPAAGGRTRAGPGRERRGRHRHHLLYRRSGGLRTRRPGTGHRRDLDRPGGSRDRRRPRNRGSDTAAPGLPAPVR